MVDESFMKASRPEAVGQEDTMTAGHAPMSWRDSFSIRAICRLAASHSLWYRRMSARRSAALSEQQARKRAVDEERRRSSRA